MIIPVTWDTMAGSCSDDSKLSRLADLLAGEEESSKDWKIGVWAVGTPLSAGQDGYVRKCNTLPHPKLPVLQQGSRTDLGKYIVSSEPVLH